MKFSEWHPPKPPGKGGGAVVGLWIQFEGKFISSYRCSHTGMTSCAIWWCSYITTVLTSVIESSGWFSWIAQWTLSFPLVWRHYLKINTFLRIMMSSGSDRPSPWEGGEQHTNQVVVVDGYWKTKCSKRHEKDDHQKILYLSFRCFGLRNEGVLIDFSEWEDILE